MPAKRDADRDDEIQDELLRRVVAELRRPVRLDPAADARALETIRQSGRRRPVNRSSAWGLGAALAAGVLLAVLVGTPNGEPAGRTPGIAAKLPSGTRAVLLRLAAPSSSQVAVVGDFNDWDPAATPLRPTGDKGVWTVELHLKPGRYHYTFLIDGRRWESDPSEPRAPESDFGAPMSVLTVS